MKKTLYSLLSIFLFASASFADEDIRIPLPNTESNENIPQTEEKTSNEINQNKKQEGDIATQTGCFLCSCIPAYYNNGLHSLTSISIYGDSIVLKDGSVWAVDPFFKNEVFLWSGYDPLIIFPNNSLFSPYKYVIQNQALGTQIEVNMIYGPAIGNPFALQIVAIDYLRGEVFLNDHSRWYICESDLDLLYKWAEGDYIIVGTNVYPCCSLSNVLINVNMDNHIYSEQF